MSRDGKALLLRADASTRIGTGHVMRCLALAQAWQNAGGQALLACCETPDALTARWRAEGMQVLSIAGEPGSVLDARETCKLARDAGAAWVVLDGYQFPPAFQGIIKDAGLSLLCVDDLGAAAPYQADLILNQNLHANEALYRERPLATQLLLGPRFALLRREFQPWRDWVRPAAVGARRLLVTLGGSDPDNCTTAILRGLRQADLAGWLVQVVLGPGNPHRAAVMDEAGRCPFTIQVLEHVREMPALMRHADAAIAACGSTCWELLFFNLPTAALVIADNQLPSASRLTAQRLMKVVSIKSPLLASALRDFLAGLPSWFRETLERPRLVDGRGAERVVRTLGLDVPGVRPAVVGDSHDVWRCSNEPSVRAVAFNPSEIPWNEHAEWYRRKLADPDCQFLVATENEAAIVGHCRCQREPAGWVISVCLSARSRGKGYGWRVIRQAVERLAAQRGATEVHAYIRPDNEPSLRAFARAGFHQQGRRTVNGVEVAHWVAISSAASTQPGSTPDAGRAA
ncbi:MAG: UDP-2,4-diacetamido-2,4,6-trideoxy-beta-L-altropyranose hydrolase [Planctomycetia bacterium]|nr:UDP-2,4-diacetamido-2,4,6-trideoxy-beta-L-altropyranose hydrolase [Planctomycetia bacterium]